MIHHPAVLLGIFIALAAALQFGRAFRVLPVPFWCYFLPMLGSALGLIPTANPLYAFLSRHLLPVCLVLLLLAADLPAITRMGPLALAMMLAGSAGTVLGGLASFFLYQRWLPEGSWGAVGALAGSWTGGSANLLAVKEALQVPDTLIGPIILVDAGVAYTWMGLLIASAGFQNRWDRLAGRAPGEEPAGDGGERRTDIRGGPKEGAQARSGGNGGGLRYREISATSPTSEDSAAERQAPSRGWPRRESPDPGGPFPARGRTAVAIALAILISLAAQGVASRLPALGAAMSASTWAILLVTTAALFLSMTPLRKLAEAGGSSAGTFFLYVLLCSIGARGDLAAVGRAPVFLLMGVTWILIHGAVLLAAGWLCRAPLGLIAVSSQANVGGPISAPIVGATFSKTLAGVGLALAVLGNVLGTYVGLATALIARSLARAGGFG